MPEQNNVAHLAGTLRVVKDVSQSTIIQKRREQREKLLKRVGQLTSNSEQAIEQLHQMTR